MQFESLKVFCDLAETKSFTKTAQINGVSQSAVSQTISALEQHFKSLLIERSKKNFRLTTEGEVLYNYSKEILQTYDAIQQPDAGDQARHLRRDSRGHRLQHRAARFAALRQTLHAGLPGGQRPRRIPPRQPGV